MKFLETRMKSGIKLKHSADKLRLQAFQVSLQ